MNIIKYTFFADFHPPFVEKNGKKVYFLFPISGTYPENT